MFSMRQDENSREIVNQRPFDAWTECVALLYAHFVVRNSLFAAFYSARPIPVCGHFLVKFMRRCSESTALSISNEVYSYLVGTGCSCVCSSLYAYQFYAECVKILYIKSDLLVLYGYYSVYEYIYRIFLSTLNSVTF